MSGGADQRHPLQSEWSSRRASRAPGGQGNREWPNKECHQNRESPVALQSPAVAGTRLHHKPFERAMLCDEKAGCAVGPVIVTKLCQTHLACQPSREFVSILVTNSTACLKPGENPIPRGSQHPSERGQLCSSRGPYLGAGRQKYVLHIHDAQNEGNDAEDTGGCQETCNGLAFVVHPSSNLQEQPQPPAQTSAFARPVLKCKSHGWIWDLSRWDFP